MMLKSNQPNPLVLSLLAIPALFIFAPLIQYFPVGPGLKMLVLSSVFTVLLFGLLLPVFTYYKRKQVLSFAFIAVSLFFIIQTHSTNKFTPERSEERRVGKEKY